MSVLELRNIWKSFPSPDGGKLGILKGVDLALSEGEIVSIVGKSGSGKSTLLSVAALLSSQDEGSVIIRGEDTAGKSESERERIRRGIGFVFQSSSLLADFSALENAAMPLLIQGKSKKEAFAMALSMLETLGLGGRASHRPDALSGGEKQRIAIARALLASPFLVFADEPTGSLDEGTAAEIEDLLISSIKREGRSMLLVTHNTEFASRADRMLELRDGELYG